MPYVVDQYNDKEHTTTGVTPNYASTAKYQDVVRENIQKKATFDRKYDEGKKGDQARVYKKPGKYSEFGFDFDQTYHQDEMFDSLRSKNMFKVTARVT